jgi:hypothetical protein
MICAKCHSTVPEESLFCLRCGTRLGPTPAQASPNGRGALPGPTAAPAKPSAGAARATAAAPAAAPTPSVPPGGKQAYTLAFKALADERLRYRVARWVCEQAPAHPLTEVQEGLLRGDFATFLALTHDEAESARQRIQALGAHPALWRLHPATVADMLVAERRERTPKAGWSARKKVAAVGIGLAALFVFGAMAAQQYGNRPPVAPPPGTVPTIGPRP